MSEARRGSEARPARTEERRGEACSGHGGRLQGGVGKGGARPAADRAEERRGGASLGHRERRRQADRTPADAATGRARAQRRMGGVRWAELRRARWWAGAVGVCGGGRARREAAAAAPLAGAPRRGQAQQPLSRELPAAAKLSARARGEGRSGVGARRGERG
ncbi:hypothetical protein C2845_PM08G09320 [Panicum miliaceum]|uniref:Uncharacterized protein n=1 Tax=Panicum miliaceum TaxID=4540 RepID=A0A3L6R3Z3_PANMI|nr:hypothetical protein C2845_PM08G09320 [Panicum miliaceum]